MIRITTIAIFVLGISGYSLQSVATGEEVSGDATIAAVAGPSRIEIRTSSRLAGAIDSLTWNGREFINSADHGRQLQSACSFHGGRGRFVPETFNPTEAGSRHDGDGPTSASRLLSLKAEGARLETRTQMAFWLRPGERSAGDLARNTEILSRHVLEKRVNIGVDDLPHAIEYAVTFTVPDGERHKVAQFEAATAYMPSEFSKFYVLDVAEGELMPLDAGPGEQSLPIIFATVDAKFAMGIWSPDQPSPGFEHAGYGRFRFADENVVKWNCVFRVRDDDTIKPGDYAFRCYVAVGTLDDVTTTLRQLDERRKHSQ